ncbi:hypothetical protein C8F01DRAFT_274302 [Mycena amicta]|nr:hypothetical protein C8F01DRAFT_274302 [Mycena amicta]
MARVGRYIDAMHPRRSGSFAGPLRAHLRRHHLQTVSRSRIPSGSLFPPARVPRPVNDGRRCHIIASTDSWIVQTSAEGREGIGVGLPVTFSLLPLDIDQPPTHTDTSTPAFLAPLDRIASAFRPRVRPSSNTISLVCAPFDIPHPAPPALPPARAALDQGHILAFPLAKKCRRRGPSPLQWVFYLAVGGPDPRNLPSLSPPTPYPSFVPIFWALVFVPQPRCYVAIPPH